MVFNLVLLVVFGFLIGGCEHYEDIVPFNEQDCVESEDCYLEPEKGPCNAAIPRYYYDPDKGECKEFTWGGCGGVVPFETMEKCTEQCECPPENPGRARIIYPEFASEAIPSDTSLILERNAKATQYRIQIADSKQDVRYEQKIDKKVDDTLIHIQELGLESGSGYTWRVKPYNQSKGGLWVPTHSFSVK